ncbi:MAG: hypothetical protein L0154_00085 [Chloroflexi bacterium]|nr:hypothetical protein [Chloroflexota bacterium]
MRRLFEPFAILLLATTIVIAMHRDENAPFRRAAFISERSGYSEIYVSDISGENIQQVTHFRNGAQNFPEWSGDGRFISFLSYTDSEFEVHWIDVFGRRVDKVADNIYRRPAWSGTSLILADVTDGSTTLLKRIENGSTSTIASGPDVTFNVHGDWILYRAGKSLYLYHIPTRHTTLLYENMTHFREWDLYEDQVAYITNHQIYVNDGAAILPGPTPVENINWSPDGQWLYFEDRSGDRSSVARVRPDGSELQTLTDFRYCDYIREFSPDGQYLLYMKTRCGEYIMDAQTINLETGEDTYHFTFDSTIQRIPRWTNDGRLTYEVIHSAAGAIDIILYDLESREKTVFAKNPAAQSRLVISPNLKVKPWNSTLLLVTGLLLSTYDMIRMMVSRYSGWRRN